MGRLVSVLAFWLILLAGGAGNGIADEALRVRCRWWPPLTGSTPVRYYLQIQATRPAGSFDSTYVVLHRGGQERVEQEFFLEDVRYWVYYHARVQAEDALGRRGPWSMWSQDVLFEIPDP